HHVRGNHDAMRDPQLARQDAPYAIALDGVTLAVLDTTVPGRVGGALPANQLAWLDELATETTDPVLVFARPPAWHAGLGDALVPADNAALRSLVGRHDNVVGY